MKTLILIGGILIVLGIVGLVQKGINYKTTEKVIDIGPIEATASKNKTFHLSPWLSVSALAGGIVLVIVGNNGTKNV